MSLISIPFTFSAGAVIIASQHNSNFSTIYSDYNGNVDNTNIVGGAAIAYSKLSLSGNITNGDLAGSIADSKLLQITTASKVSGTAITGLASLPSGAGLIPSANLPGWVPSNIQVFIISGTWTKPSNISNVYVKVIGAGGNGGTGINNSAQGSGGGGGGGGYAEGIIAVTGNVTVTIGATNSFAGTTTIQATAGSAGSNGASGAGGAGGAGGVGSNGTINLTGQKGHTGGFVATTFSGDGGSSFMGFGGLGVLNTATGTKNNGSSYGGGGSGEPSINQSAGGTGDAGAVIVYY